MSSLFSIIYSQKFQTLPYPDQSLEGKTVIVTGSNVGLGKEAARHITRLGASTVILAVRSLEKGEDAKREIEESTGAAKGIVQVWQLDLASYKSVKDFAARASKELSRVDVLLENAGVATRQFRKAEENELTVTVNVLSTFLLALLMLSKLKETAQKFNIRPVLTIVTSDIHIRTQLPERKVPEGQLFNALSDQDTAVMTQRYPVSKLMEVFVVREICENHPSSSYPIIINTVNPGLCHSELGREAAGMVGWIFYIFKLLLARTTEYGSRTLVHAGLSGPESHGRYLSDCKVAQPSVFVLSDEGQKLQKRVWKELSDELEKIQPGILKNL